MRRQLRALLSTAGTPHPRDPAARVRAYSLERLDRACLDVVHEGVRDPDKAIAVLLIKLADTTDVSDQRAADSKRELEADDTQRKRDVADARLWLADNPRAEIAPLDNAADVPAPEFAHLEYELRLLAAWRKAGEPRPARTA